MPAEYDHPPDDDYYHSLGVLETRPSSNGNGSSSEPSAWDPWDVAAAVQRVCDPDYVQPSPTVGDVTDGSCLFYTGAVNTLFGEPSTGKSWFALYICIQKMLAGSHVMWLDWEDHIDRVVSRLIHDLSVPPVTVAAFFHYRHPHGKPDNTDLQRLTSEVAEFLPAVVVIDSVGEAMGDQGYKQNDDDAVVAWIRQISRPVASYGPAVIILDHVVKDSEGRGRWAIGSQRKLAVIDGAAYRVDTIRPFARGVSGLARLTVTKDRHGTRPVGSIACECPVTASDEGRLAILFRPHVPLDEQGSDGGVVRTVLAERISRWLELQPSAQPVTAIEQSVTGKNTQIRLAVQELVRADHVGSERGGNGYPVYSSLKPFREHPHLDVGGN